MLTNCWTSSVQGGATRYREFAPARELGALVSHYWIFEKGEGEALFSYDRFMPEAEPFMLFQAAGAYTRIDPASGSSTEYPGVVVCAGAHRFADVRVDGRSLSAGVRFRGAGAVSLDVFSPREVGSVSSYSAAWSDNAASVLSELLLSGRWHDLPGFLDAVLLRRLTLRRLADDWSRVESYLLRRTGRAELDQLVDLFGGSTRRFERACLQSTGYTPREFRSLVRCDFARSVLFVDPSPDLSDLAFGLGFFDLPHFCRTFKRWSGMTPLEFNAFCAPFRVHMREADRMRHHEDRLESFRNSLV